MRTRLGFLAVLILCATCAWGQSKVRLIFGSAGPREVWVAPRLDDLPPAGAIATEASSFDLPVSGPAPQDVVFVWDRKTGNLAFKPLAQAKGGWTVGVADYRRLGKVVVRVEHGGKPVAAASIALEGGGKKHNRVLSPSDGGEVAFFGLLPGAAKVTVTYSSGGKTLSLPAQTFDLKLVRDQPDLKLTTVIDQDVSVVEDEKPVAPAPPAGTSERESGRPQGSTLGSMVVYVLGVAAALGVAYALLRYVQKNQTLVEEKLEKLGVAIPKDPGDADDDASAPPPPKQPEPQQPIILGDADPNPTAIGTSPVATGVASVANPRLVREDGSLLLIPDTGGVVGRDAAVEMSLPNETTLSRRHAELIRTGSDVAVRDLGSTNGTYVNGAKVADAPMTLRNGDAVQLGAVRFRYEV